MQMLRFITKNLFIFYTGSVLRELKFRGIESI